MWVLKCELRERRMERHLTQTDLAKLLQASGLQVTREMLSTYERGKHQPLATQANIIARVLGCRSEDIWRVEWAEKKHP